MSIPISRACVVGDGAMGTVCALILCEQGINVTLWGRSPAHVESLCRDRENKKYLSGFSFPDSLKVTNDADIAFSGAELIVSAVPVQFMRGIWSKLAGHFQSGVPIVSVAKGIEITTLLLPSAIMKACLSHVSTACLSGPSIASEVAAHKPASLVVASDDESVAKLVQQSFSTSYVRVYSSTDHVGVELAGAAKNVIAIAAGICDGIGAGDNAKASLLTRGLVEIARLGEVFDAHPETFRGLAGVGDLFTTCVSKVGRNRSAGERIGRGETTEQVLATTASVIEGIPTTRSIVELANKHEVEMPIVEAISAVLFEGESPAEAIERLMTRRLRSEP